MPWETNKQKIRDDSLMFPNDQGSVSNFLTCLASWRPAETFTGLFFSDQFTCLPPKVLYTFRDPPLFPQGEVLYDSKIRTPLPVSRGKKLLCSHSCVSSPLVWTLSMHRVHRPASQHPIGEYEIWGTDVVIAKSNNKSDKMSRHFKCAFKINKYRY